MFLLYPAVAATAAQSTPAAQVFAHRAELISPSLVVRRAEHNKRTARPVSVIAAASL
jgi:hypothetical protein